MRLAPDPQATGWSRHML